ncbi:MAG: hypothetical protein GY851_34065 [bacterium]|nr:hypothetical protein [bacterium]
MSSFSYRGCTGMVMQANSNAASARTKADQQSFRVEELERRVDRLGLACQALWEILREQTEITDDELMSRMEEIDLRDGKADGKIGAEVLACPTCGRHLNSRNPTCIYCGTEVLPGPIAG